MEKGFQMHAGAKGFIVLLQFTSYHIRCDAVNSKVSELFRTSIKDLAGGKRFNRYARSMESPGPGPPQPG